MMNYILYGLSCVNLRSLVRTGLSPPEEEPSFHSVRAQEEEEEEEAVFIRGVNTNEDPPNAHQAQHRPVQATGAMSA